MAEPRIHLPGPLATGATLSLPEPAFRHVVQVLRMRTGEALILFDGGGGEYEARLEAVGKREAQVRVGAFRDVNRESPLRVTLAQAVSKGERMDYTIQKAVELGVSEIVPLLSERSVVKLDAERWDKKLEHWRGIAASACEQSGRTQVPLVRPVAELPRWLHEPSAGLRLVLAPGAGGALPDQLPPAAPVVLLVGPEGGFSEAELDLARRQGCRPLQLGPRTLRTETAGLAALAVLQARWGDFARGL